MTNKAFRERRAFLAKMAGAAVAGSTMGAMSGRIELMGSALAASGNYSSLNDHKSLVCVFLYGGSDSFDMFVPTNSSEYAQYAAARGSLRTPRGQLLPTTDGAIGFNPALRGLRRRYNRGDLAIVRNVGNLIEPLDRAQFQLKSVPVPSDLFAHDQQQEQWLKGISSRPAGVTNSGWGGRIADCLMEANQTDLPPTLSVFGSNFWQPGARTQPVSLHPLNGLSLLPYLDGVSYRRNADREATMNAILRLNRSHPMKRQSAQTFDRSLEMSRTIDSTLDNSPSFNTQVDGGSRLAQQLRMVARLIAAREQLGMRRQIFFVAMGGWDTHDNQAFRLPLLLNELNDGLVGFQQTVEELGIEQSVTTFTSSEFGRTLSTNGDGTDHGWGGSYIAMGGAVQGGRIYGDPINFRLGSPRDAGDGGRIIPAHSISQFGGILAQWMGITNRDLADIFPDLSNHGSNWRDGLQFMG